MFRIGEFSRLANVTIETLRHYAALGLLPPAHIDPLTGYRYYSATQLRPLSRILALKELGFSLEDIARLLQVNGSADLLRGMLELQLVAAERDVRAAQSRIARLNARLAGLEMEGHMPEPDVLLKPVAATAIASIREVVPRIDDMPERCSAMFATVAQWLTGSRAPFGASLTIYHGASYSEAQIDAECGFMLPDTAAAQIGSPPAPIGVRTLDAVPLMATTIVTDDFYRKVGGLTPAYHALARWLEANGYEVSGPAREVFHGSPAQGDLTAEIQMPVRKA